MGEKSIKERRECEEKEGNKVRDVVYRKMV